MKYFFISAILLCFIFSASVYAQHTYATNALSGIVKDANGKPLTAATIHIVDLKIGSITNDSGFFEIKNIPKGKFWVEVQYIGYARIAEWISVDGDTKKYFVLQPKIMEDNEVTVTGVKALIEEKVDRLVYNADKDLLARGGDASDGFITSRKGSARK